MAFDTITIITHFLSRCLLIAILLTSLIPVLLIEVSAVNRTFVSILGYAASRAVYTEGLVNIPYEIGDVYGYYIHIFN